jgi:hypothetical protein
VSLRDQIVAANDRTTKATEVPEWGVTVELRSMTAGQRIAMYQTAYDPNSGQTDLKTLYPAVLTACLFDPKTKQPIFTADDAQVILDKSGAVIERLAMDAIALSGVSESAVTEAGKALLGNQSDDSSMN